MSRTLSGLMYSLPIASCYHHLLLLDGGDILRIGLFFAFLLDSAFRLSPFAFRKLEHRRLFFLIYSHFMTIGGKTDLNLHFVIPASRSSRVCCFNVLIDCSNCDLFAIDEANPFPCVELSSRLSYPKP
jgi:hypothetical protein